MNKFIFSAQKKLLNLLGGKVKNQMSLPQQFLRYGMRGQPMYPEWSEPFMSDYDHYSGYGYSAILKRANMTARTALDKVRTESNQKEFVHPYLNIITESPTFTDYQFWSIISTYLDLEGIFYLMAIRAYDEASQRFGNIQSFKLLNPYRIRRVVNYTDQGLQIGGYVETLNGYYREIPKELIIEIKELNPFDEVQPFAKSDAAKNEQFTLKTAGDYTRNALKHNINAAGIISTDVKLDEPDFQNFMARVSKHTKGEPLFGNGEGAVKWENMQNNLKDSALKDIGDINRDILFSVYGVSKTIMGIEESGTTRDTSEVQKALMFESQILPQIENIIGALNQDYKNTNPNWQNNKAKLVVDNPVTPDYAATNVYIDMLGKQVDLYQSLINKGVDNKLAAAFVQGDASLEDLALKPIEIPDVTPAIPGGSEKPLDTGTGSDVDKGINTLQQNRAVQQGIVEQQQGALQNAIVNIDKQLLAAALMRVPKKMQNSADLRQKDVITQQEQNEAERDLALVLLAFYGIVINMQGQTIMRSRMSEFGIGGLFSFNTDINNLIKTLSNKAAESHISTVTNEIYIKASEAAKEGKSAAQIEQLLRKSFPQEVSENRAKLVARSETNRAFTTAQFEADRQFVAQNDLEVRAYKQWETRSDNPCPFCESLAKEPPILLDNNFRDLGSTIDVKDQSMKVNYLPLEAGNAHPNCSCDYKLIILPA